MSRNDVLYYTALYGAPRPSLIESQSRDVILHGIAPFLGIRDIARLSQTSAPMRRILSTAQIHAIVNTRVQNLARLEPTALIKALRLQDRIVIDAMLRLICIHPLNNDAFCEVPRLFGEFASKYINISAEWFSQCKTLDNHCYFIIHSIMLYFCNKSVEFAIEWFIALEKVCYVPASEIFRKMMSCINTGPMTATEECSYKKYGHIAEYLYLHNNKPFRECREIRVKEKLRNYRNDAIDDLHDTLRCIGSNVFLEKLDPTDENFENVLVVLYKNINKQDDWLDVLCNIYKQQGCICLPRVEQILEALKTRCKIEFDDTLLVKRRDESRGTSSSSVDWNSKKFSLEF